MNVSEDVHIKGTQQQSTLPAADLVSDLQQGAASGGLQQVCPMQLCQAALAEQRQLAGLPADSKVQLVMSHRSRNHGHTHTSRCVMRVDVYSEGSPGARVQPLAGHPGLVAFSGVLGNGNATLGEGKRRLTNCRQAGII